MIEQYHEKFETYLTRINSRYTTQKRNIVDSILKQNDHFEVDEFLFELHKAKEDFSRATVYRTIKQLLEANLLQKVTTHDGKVYYEKSTTEERHDHLICNSCGKILEIKDNTIDKQLKKLCQSLNFHPEYRSLQIYGLCATCKK